MPNNVITTPPYSYFDYDTFTSVTVPGTVCRFINEVKICEDQIQPAPFPNIPKFCETIAVDINYDYYEGSLDCYTAANGDTVCPEAGGGELDTCQQYEDNPSCGFISADCIDGTESANGTCYIFNEVWDCGEDVQIQDVESTLEIDCTGPIRCMGDDCIDPNKTQSASFAEVSAKLQAAQFMSQDMNCVEVTGTANVNCTVFGGEGYTCKKAMGGVQDCCDVPTNITMVTYLRGIMSVGVLDSSVMNLQSGSAIKGAWEVIRTPVTSTYSTVTKPFTSYIDSISGSVTEFFEPVTSYVDTLVTEIQAAIDGVIQDMIGKAGADMGANAATSTAANTAKDTALEQGSQSMIGSAAGYLMTAYTAYVVAVMVIQIIWECETPEFELAAKKTTKSCQYLGSYCKDRVLGVCIEKRESFCCFNSPLSRIINAQVRPQIGVPYGDIRNPNCGGLTMDQIASIDWTQIDLSEWTAILTTNSMMPDVNTMTLDSLTGSGNAFNMVDPDTQRLDAEQRLFERIGQEDLDQHRKDATTNMIVDPTGAI
jgi:conjugal transfer mating pair stabilization protein TraN